MKGRRPDDEEIVILGDDGDGRDEVARAMEDAERAVSAVEQRHRRQGEGDVVPADAPGSPPAGADRELSALRDELAAAQEEAGRLREALLRKAADLENVKRRTEREKSDYFKYALTETFRDLLGVLDNFHRAMAHAEAGGGEGGGEFRAGIVMIERQLADVLRKYGLAEITALGQPFDPNVHEAVMTEATADAPPGTVLDVLQKGYMLNERLLRPAMVKVSAAPPRRS